MDFEAKLESHAHIEEATLEVRMVKVVPSEQLCLEKYLATSRGKYPLAHVVIIVHEPDSQILAIGTILGE